MAPVTRRPNNSTSNITCNNNINRNSNIACRCHISNIIAWSSSTRLVDNISGDHSSIPDLYSTISAPRSAILRAVTTCAGGNYMYGCWTFRRFCLRNMPPDRHTRRPDRCKASSFDVNNTMGDAIRRTIKCVHCRQLCVGFSGFPIVVGT